jgi:SAM-dependent methyltransferase
MTNYWRTRAEDEAMQDDHVFVWKTMLESVDIDLAEKRVLDVGCNRGGFLRLVYDQCGIAEGFGYDPASEAVADARRLADRRPLHFDTADTVPVGWDLFDVAFSHEVLYLIRDLAAHADDVFRALAPGGVYYAVMGMHAASPLQVEWHRAHSAELAMPPLRDIDDVVGVFVAAGFTAAASRLNVGFLPTAGHTPRLMEWLEYYDEKKLLLRFIRPGSA